MGEGQEPTASSRLTCEGQCGDAHAAVGFSHPCRLLSSAWSTMHILQVPKRPPSSVPGPCLLWAPSPLAVSCRSLLAISLPLGLPLWCSCQNYLYSLCCMGAGC